MDSTSLRGQPQRVTAGRLDGERTNWGTSVRRPDEGDRGDVSLDRASTFSENSGLDSDLHRIAPNEEVILDALVLQARLQETEEAHIEAALCAHALDVRSPSQGFHPKPRVPRRSPSLIWLVALATLGLVVGMAGALARS